MYPLLLTMTLHLHCGRWWPILFPPYCELLNFQKGCIPGAVCILLPAEHILGGTSGLPVVHLLHGNSHGFYPDTITRDEVLIS